MKHMDKDKILGYCDLHNHLYGCLTAEHLYNIGKNNPQPRWKIFTEPYQEIFKTKINPDTFFQDYRDMEKFKKLYYFDHRGPFPEFQAKFNLIIALVEFTYEEMARVAEQVVLDHASHNVKFAEYRIMFARDETREKFEERIRSTCRGIQSGEKKARLAGLDITARLAYSLHRGGNYLENYEWIKEFLLQDKLVRHYLTGIDFCYVEEGHPPIDKKDFFQKILLDNQNQPSTALAILYHVGESYQDKTPFSASRWVLESSLYGAHRLGHCIAMGIHPDIFLNQKRVESPMESTAQCLWELENYDSIRESGDYYTKQEIESKLKKISSSINESNQSKSILEMEFTERDCVYLNTFQDYCMREIAGQKSVIESCPSSNYYIGMIQSPEEHPLPRFLQANLPVTIASDDPGIFNTNIPEEYKKAGEMGISSDDLEEIQQKSFQYKSELISGRKD